MVKPMVCALMLHLMCTLLSKGQKIEKLVETTVRNIVDNCNDLRNVQLSRVKSREPHEFVFIKSRNDDYELTVGQKFLYCKYPSNGSN